MKLCVPSMSRSKTGRSKSIRSTVFPQYYGAAEAVDRVVVYQTLGDEVVRAFDVEVEDGPVQVDPLNSLDDVVATCLGEHCHAGTNGPSWGKWQTVAFDAVVLAP